MTSEKRDKRFLAFFQFMPHYRMSNNEILVERMRFLKFQRFFFRTNPANKAVEPPRLCVY